MRILAMDTSGRRAAVAALEDDRVLAECDSPPGVRSAAALAPLIAELLKGVDWQLRRLDLIAVTQGPGSFTGLRIGVTTAKTLAYATGAAVIGVNTLEVIAAGAPARCPS